MELSDEALVGQFTRPQTSSSEMVFSRKWSLCFLTVVMSNRPVMDDPFASAMMRAWSCDLLTTFTIIDKNTFLMKFKDEVNYFMPYTHCHGVTEWIWWFQSRYRTLQTWEARASLMWISSYKFILSHRK
jgi:hypothetical protein